MSIEELLNPEDEGTGVEHQYDEDILQEVLKGDHEDGQEGDDSQVEEPCPTHTQALEASKTLLSYLSVRAEGWARSLEGLLAMMARETWYEQAKEMKETHINNNFFRK